jgi:hypothetical protein
MSGTRITEGAEALVKVPECGSLERARAGDGGFVFGDLGRESGLTEQFASATVERAKKELLGAAVLDIKVPGGPAEAGGGTDGDKSAGLVAGAAKAGLIDKAFDQQDWFAVMVKPVLTELFEDQGEDAGGEIGKLLTVGKDEEAGVVDDQTETTDALARRPADPLIPGLDVKGCAGEEEDGDGLAIEKGDVAQGGAGDIGLMEVMVLLESAVELSAFMRLNEADLDALKQTGLGNGVCGSHRVGSMNTDCRRCPVQKRGRPS